MLNNKWGKKGVKSGFYRTVCVGRSGDRVQPPAKAGSLKPVFFPTCTGLYQVLMYQNLFYIEMGEPKIRNLSPVLLKL